MKKLIGSVLMGAMMTSGAVAQDWNGFYAGVSASTGTTEYSSGFLAINPTGSSTSPGVFAGYNYAMSNNMVLSGELSYGGVDSSATIGGGGTAIEMDAMKQVRARLGYASGNVMPYVSVGWAKADISVPSNSVSISENGHSMGLGLEYMFSNNMSARVEYSKTKFNRVLAPLVAPNELDASHEAITFGMGWHF